MKMKMFWPDKKLLHKDDDADVLIYNIRRALPRFINKDVFERIICMTLSDDDRNFLTQFYRIPELPSEISNKHDALKNNYVYSNLPFFIMNKEFTRLSNTLKNRDKEHFFTFYEQIEQGYLLKKIYINENDELRILSFTGRRDLKASDYDKTRLSRILEPFSEISFPSYYYCNMYNDTKHYYFYRKDHEHVPGVMLIEVARQAGYAYAYLYSGFKRGEMTLSWEKAEMVFPNYTQSNYPVRVMMEDISPEPDAYQATGVKRTGVRITLFQDYKIVAIINNYGPAIRMDVFNEIRTAGMEDTHLRFIPIKYFANTILLIADGNKYNCFLKNISAKGFGISCDNQLPESRKYQFFLHIDCIGDVYGTCALKWQEQADRGYNMGFEIDNVTSDDECKLKEAIKKYTYLEEYREIV